MGKINEKKWSQIWKLLLIKGVKFGNIITPKPLKLESWNFEIMFTPHNVSCVTLVIIIIIIIIIILKKKNSDKVV